MSSIIVELIFLPFRLSVFLASGFLNVLPDDPKMKVGVIIAMGVFGPTIIGLIFKPIRHILKAILVDIKSLF